MLKKYKNRNDIPNDKGPVWQLNFKRFNDVSEVLGYAAAMCTEHDCSDTYADRDAMICTFSDIEMEPNKFRFEEGVRTAYDEIHGDVGVLDEVPSFEDLLIKAINYEGV